MIHCFLLAIAFTLLHSRTAAFSPARRPICSALESSELSSKNRHLRRQPHLTTVFGSPDVGGGGSITIAKPVQDKKKKINTKSNRGPGGGDGWELTLFNDEKNYRSYVADCLVTIVGLSESRAYQAMMSAHTNGRGSCGEYCQERAELFKDELQNKGLTVGIHPV